VYEKMWPWEEWQEHGRNLPDLSLEGIRYGTTTVIPLQCPGILRGNKPCKTKLSDGTPNFKTKESNVKCPICKYYGVRVVGLKK